MDSKEIRELIELISASEFATFELERKDFRLKLVKQQSPMTIRPATGIATEAAASEPVLPPEVLAGGSQPAAAEAPAEGAAPVENGLVDLRSPIVGTFFQAPGPDAPPFVEVGSAVKKGQVVCIVEAMKVMNEIESELDAQVVEVLVTNGQPVEYGEVLFRLRPNPA